MSSNKTAFKYRRIIIIGLPASGKSTLALILSKLLNIQSLDLDTLHKLNKSSKEPDKTFRMETDKATRTSAWVLAGDYGIVRDIIWPRAELIIWLDYPLWTIFRQYWIRSTPRGTYKKIILEEKSKNLLPRIGHLITAFQKISNKYKMKKHNYPLLFRQADFNHLDVMRFTCIGETQKWLKEIQDLTP